MKNLCAPYGAWHIIEINDKHLTDESFVQDDLREWHGEASLLAGCHWMETRPVYVCRDSFAFNRHGERRSGAGEKVLTVESRKAVIANQSMRRSQNV